MIDKLGVFPELTDLAGTGIFRVPVFWYAEIRYGRKSREKAKP